MMESLNPSAQPGPTLCKALSRIQAAWGFNNVQMAELLHARPNTYGNWMSNGSIPIGKVLTPESEAILSFIAIYRSVAAMFSNPKDQMIWFTQPHPVLRETSPRDFVKQSTANLFWLRSYLDYARGKGA